jgi:hypothetical protein
MWITCEYTVKNQWLTRKNANLQKNYYAGLAYGDQKLFVSHFPMQNDEKITPNKSSDVNSPVISDR